MTLNYFEQNGNHLIWRNRNETLVLTPWGTDGLRVRSALVHDVEDFRFALLEPQETAAVIEISENAARIVNGNLTAEIRLGAGCRGARISFYNQRGELLLRETDKGGALDLSSRDFAPVIGGDFALTATFEGQEDEHIWGMGQYQEEVIDWKGATLELKQRNSQASVPFYISSRGYGFLWHNPALGSVTFGSNRTSWYAESTKQLDYWVTCGDTPADISRHYGEATGFAPEMPEYGLGFWQCKLRYWNQEQVLDVAREYRRRGLKVDVIVIDFFHWPRMGDFRFDEEFFPDPAAMVQELQSMGIELMVSIWPQVAFASENYPEMLQQGLLVRAEYGAQIGMRFVEDSMFFDATNPRARDYVWKKIRKNYYDAGIRLFWLDEAEPEYNPYDVKQYRYNLGPAQQVGNIFPQLYTKMFYDGLTAEHVEKPVNLVRCAWAGSQRYGALVWSGDIHSRWEDFRNQICAGIHMGCAGIPWWTTDIGGFEGGWTETEEFRELLVRWFQWGTYCPVMRLHGDRLPRRPVARQDGTKMLHSGGDNEVWSFGETAYPILTACMARREELRPYLRQLMHLAHTDLTPIIRGMFYEFPKDPNCIGLKDQYMFGPEYLVAPVLYPGQRERSVYLPEGQWQDVADGTVYNGGQRITVDAPLEKIPVFKRL